MRHHASDPGQGSPFGAAAAPEPPRRAMDANIPMPGHAYLRRGAKPTSAVAAATALPRSGTQRAGVLEAIRAAGSRGMTDQEIAVALGLAENSVRPRRLELSTPPEGMPRLVFKAAVKRPTSAGNDATVWVSGEHVQGAARGA
jgi:hypothetical protein